MLPIRHVDVGDGMTSERAERGLRAISETGLPLVRINRKTRLAALRVRGNLLVLQTLLWPDEVRAMRFRSLDNVERPDDAQIRAAEALAYALSGDFDPDEHIDEYQTELKRVLDAAIAAGKPAVTERPSGLSTSRDAEVEDLIAALRRSVDTATVEPKQDT